MSPEWRQARERSSSLREFLSYVYDTTYIYERRVSAASQISYVYEKLNFFLTARIMPAQSREISSSRVRGRGAPPARRAARPEPDRSPSRHRPRGLRTDSSGN